MDEAHGKADAVCDNCRGYILAAVGILLILGQLNFLGDFSLASLFTFDTQV